MRRLIFLRPEPGASASVARARAMGIEAIATPLFEIVPLPWTVVPDDFDGIVATSANAFRHGGAGLEGVRMLPVHAVGEATAAAALAAGFTIASVGDGGATDMAMPAGRWLHLAGRDHVRVPGTTPVAIYKSTIIEPAPLLNVTGAVVAVHSARAGARLAELVADRTAAWIIAISAAAAEACGPGWGGVMIAEVPRESAMLALARQLCQNGGR